MFLKRPGRFSVVEKLHIFQIPLVGFTLAYNSQDGVIIFMIEHTENTGQGPEGKGRFLLSRRDWILAGAAAAYFGLGALRRYLDPEIGAVGPEGDLRSIEERGLRVEDCVKIDRNITWPETIEMGSIHGQPIQPWIDLEQESLGKVLEIGAVLVLSSRDYEARSDLVKLEVHLNKAIDYISEQLGNYSDEKVLMAIIDSQDFQAGLPPAAYQYRGYTSRLADGTIGIAVARRFIFGKTPANELVHARFYQLEQEGFARPPRYLEEGISSYVQFRDSLPEDDFKRLKRAGIPDVDVILRKFEPNQGYLDGRIASHVGWAYIATAIEKSNGEITLKDICQFSAEDFPSVEEVEEFLAKKSY